MNKTWISALAFAAAALAGSARAADLPSMKAPPVILPPPLTWTGAYFGANVGGVFDASSGVTTTTGPLFDDTGNNSGAGFGPTTFGSVAAAALANKASLSGAGVIGGGQIGYNWQFNNFVAGLEADIQGTTLSSAAKAFGSVTEPTTGSLVSAQSNLSKDLRYLGTVRGRLGFLVTPTLLIYGTGGLAYGGMNFSNGVFISSSNPAFPISAVSANYGDAHVGWTVGGGGEWLFMPNWSAKVEYLYYDLGSISTTGVVATPFPGGNLLYAAGYRSSANFNGHIVRAGVNYHFHWFAPAPVLAKY